MSFAERDRKRNMGTSQTQTPKNVATSMKLSSCRAPFHPFAPPPGTYLRGSLARELKWLNATKWSRMTRTQERRKAGLRSEMDGQARLKFWRYTTCETSPRSVSESGSPSTRCRRTRRTRIACGGSKCPGGFSHEKRERESAGRT